MDRFISKPIISSQTFGERLSKVREAQNLSLKDVSRKIGIKESYLSAIEGGRFGELPGEIYALQFSRSYAKFLGMDPDAIADSFKSEKLKSLSKALLSKSIFLKYIWRNKQLFYAKMLFLLLLVFTVFGAAFYLRGFAVSPNLEILSPTQYYKTQDHSLKIKGRVSQKSYLYINDIFIKFLEKGDFEETVYLPGGQSLLKISAKSDQGKEKFVWMSLYILGGEI